MISSIEQNRLEVDHREAGDHAVAQDARDPLLHARHILFGTVPPTTLLLKAKPAPGCCGSRAQLDAGELP